MKKIHIQPRHLFQLAVRSFKAWSDDYAPSMGAAIAYYTVFSVAPLLVIVIAVAGAVFGRDAVQGQIARELGGLVGQQGAAMVQQLVAASSNTHKGLVAGTISIFVLLLGATSVFTELQNALDRIWHVPPSQKATGMWAILRARLLSFGLILGLVFLLMVSLVVSTIVAAFGSYTSRLFPGAEIVLQLLNTLVSLAISTGLFAMIYKMLPNTRIAWRDVWIGAVVTAVLFEVGKFLIGLYLGKSSMSQTFAAAGSLVILIAWIYYAAQIFLLGAEFTKLYAQEHGSHAATQAMQGTQATAQAGMPVAAPVPAPALPHAARHARHAARKPSPEREAAIARLQYNREQLRQTEPAPKLARAKSVLAGASTVAGMAVAAWARRSRRKHQAA